MLHLWFQWSMLLNFFYLGWLNCYNVIRFHWSDHIGYRCHIQTFHIIDKVSITICKGCMIIMIIFPLTMLFLFWYSCFFILMPPIFFLNWTISHDYIFFSIRIYDIMNRFCDRFNNLDHVLTPFYIFFATFFIDLDCLEFLGFIPWVLLCFLFAFF